MLMRVLISILLLAALRPAPAELPALVSHHQVLQRQSDSATSCTIPLPSASSHHGNVIVQVRNSSATLLLEQETAVAESAEGEKAVTLTNLPLGGPYWVSVRDKQGKTLKAFEQVLVGDLWIAAGQSNMQGVVPAEDALKADAHLQMLSMDGRWLDALPPTHRVYDADVPIMNMLIKRVLQKSESEIAATRKASLAEKPVGGTGPDYFFARELYRETGVPVGLIPCAFGGTSLVEWEPALREQGDASLYGFMYKRFKQAGGRVRGIIWYQGENEASGDELSRAMYADRFVQFVAALRRDMDAPELPVIMAQLCRFPRADAEIPRGWDLMREIQRNLADRLPHVHLIPTIDLPQYDGLHISYAAQKVLGRRMAHIAAGYADRRLAPRHEIKLAGASVEGGFRDAVRITFTGVQGQLGAPGRATGFQVRSSETRLPLDVIFDTYFDGPATVILRTNVPLHKGTQLYYGAGGNPYANIGDAAGMGLPAFGPIMLE
jgi:sialate O-acetylesterase